MYKQEWNVGWEVREAAGRSAASRPEWQAVDLPQDLAIGKPRSQCYPTGGAGGYAWSGLATYRKRFVAPAEWRGRSVQLEFEGVYMNAEVSLNHQLLALHPYGYTSFIVDLTPHLRLGEENELRVVVNNTAQPNSRWYSGTGIYRPVWLRLGGALHIQPWGVFVTTPVAKAAASTVRVLTALAGVSAGAVLRSTIVSAQGEALASVETPITGATVEQILDVSGVQLWSLTTPALYTLRSEVLLGVEVVDVEETTFGFREVCIDAQHGLRLNGEPLKLKGGCIHHDNGLLGAASYARAEERKVELLKASGYNAIRCAHNPPAPALLDACDRLGMLVIDESFDCWRTGKNPNDYHLYFEEWWQRDVAAMVVRDRNHPSIIAWSIGNEVPERAGLSDGYAWARRQAEYIRSLDPTRPITSALPFLFEEPFQALLPKAEGDPTQNSFNVQRHVPVDAAHDIWGQLTRPFCDALDIVGYNYMHARYACDGEHFPGRVIAGTETYPWFAFESWRETERLPWVIGDFVWTAMDYLGESAIGGVAVDQPYAQFFADPWPVHLAGCGDLDLSGVKRPQSYYHDLLWGGRTAPFIAVLEPRLYGHKVAFSPWGWEPVSGSWSFPGQEGQPARVDVYALEDEVELLLNGVSLGRKPAGPAQRNKASFDVTYEPGTLEAVGYCAGQPVSRATLSSTGAPAALRLAVDRGALPAGRGEVAYVAVEIIDAQGCRVPYADLPVTLTVTGAGELLAIGSANPAREEPYVGATRRAYEGRLL
ncbi:MAG: glycoside hydrolase family 2 TIM barrel-domain containing protein, partial [Anaerolineales bacterium]